MNRAQRRAYQRKTKHKAKVWCPDCKIDTVRIHKQTGIFEEGDVCEVCGKVFNRRPLLPNMDKLVRDLAPAAENIRKALPDPKALINKNIFDRLAEKTSTSMEA